MHCHFGTNNRAQLWTFTDPCKPEVRPGAREESASPAWLATPAMNARDTTKVSHGGLTLHVDRHYTGRMIKLLSIYQPREIEGHGWWKRKIKRHYNNRKVRARGGGNLP